MLGGSQEQLVMAGTPKVIAYRISMTAKDLALYKTKSTQIQRKSTWSTNTNKEMGKGKATIHIADEPTTRIARDNPERVAKRPTWGKEKPTNGV